MVGAFEEVVAAVHAAVGVVDGDGFEALHLMYRFFRDDRNQRAVSHQVQEGTDAVHFQTDVQFDVLGEEDGFQGVSRLKAFGGQSQREADEILDGNFLADSLQFADAPDQAESALDIRTISPRDF